MVVVVVQAAGHLQESMVVQVVAVQILEVVALATHQRHLPLREIMVEPDLLMERLTA